MSFTISSANVTRKETELCPVVVTSVVAVVVESSWVVVVTSVVVVSNGVVVVTSVVVVSTGNTNKTIQYEPVCAFDPLG